MLYEVITIPFANDFTTEPEKGAWLLRDRHREQGLLLFTHQGPFGDIAQPIEVHVRPTVNRNEGLFLNVSLPDISLQSGGSQGTGRLDDRPGRLVNTLDCATDLVDINADNLIDILATDIKG